MKMDADLAAWICICQIPGVGNAGLRKLLQNIGSPADIFNSASNILQLHVSPNIADRICAGLDQAQVETAALWLSADPANSILTIADSDYPLLLLNTPDPPLLLYVKGRRELLNVSSISVVGSRHATPQGIRNADAFAESLSNSGLCIISGLAQGVDTAAHVGGLRGVSSSVAVVGTGLDRVYPAANRDLAHTLACKGAVISEFPLGTPPLAKNFPKRNRIISGLSLGCLVVEASLQSGSLITARMAVEQGREVFALPGSIHSPQSKGCHSLIKQGAKLVDDVSDILDELHIDPQFILARSANDKGETSHFLLDHLGFEAVDVDTLSLSSGLTIEQLSSILLQLELDGFVEKLPGGLYQRVV